MNELDLKINKIAQNIIPKDEGVKWFEKQVQNDIGSTILGQLSMFIQQAHPKPDEVEKAIQISKLKPTFTPCVLITSKSLKDALHKIVYLPKEEQLKSFKLLISLLSIADERRRNTNCVSGCHHEWHNL